MEDRFHNISSYKRYLKCKSLAESVNTLLSEGYIIVDDEGEVFKDKFLFIDHTDSEPVIMAGNIIYIGGTWDTDSDLIYIDAADAKEFIRKVKKFKMVNPKYIERIQL